MYVPVLLSIWELAVNGFGANSAIPLMFFEKMHAHGVCLMR